MANRNGNIPENCEKFLFAEDVVRFFLSEILDVHYQPVIASPYRDFVYEAFNDTVKRAMFSIYNRIKTYRMVHEIEERDLNRRLFIQYAKRLRKLFFKKGFDANFFLYYCVHLAITSTKLVNFIGLQRAANLTVHCIVKGISKFDMLLGGWDTLNIVAEKMVTIENYADSHTPDYEVALAPEDDNLRISSSEDDDSEDVENSDGNDDAVENIHFDELKVRLDVGNELESQAVPETANVQHDSVVKHKEIENTTKDGTSPEENSKQIKSSYSVQLSDMGSIPLHGENKAERHSDAPVIIFLAPESENSSVPSQEKRSPKRDHTGSVISRSVQTLDVPSSSSYLPVVGSKHSPTSVKVSESNIEQSEDTPSFDENDVTTSKKSKFT